MAIRMSEPMQRAPKRVDDEIRDMILRHGGSSDLARVVLLANEYARTKGDEAQSLRHALDRLREENTGLREWIKQEGEQNNTCTFNVLGEVCSYCACKRRKP